MRKNFAIGFVFVAALALVAMPSANAHITAGGGGSCAEECFHPHFHFCRDIDVNTQTDVTEPVREDTVITTPNHYVVLEEDGSSAVYHETNGLDGLQTEETEREDGTVVPADERATESHLAE